MRGASDVVHISCVDGSAHTVGPRHEGDIRRGYLGRDRKAMKDDARGGNLPGVGRLVEVSSSIAGFYFVVLCNCI